MIAIPMALHHPASDPFAGMDVDAARAFLRRLDPDAERFTLQTYDDTDAERTNLARVHHVQIDGPWPEVMRSFNVQRAGIFVTVNETDGRGRKAHNIARVRAVFVDLDGAPLDPVLAAGLAPHLIVESSPLRWHAYWRVSDCPLDQFKPVQQALARRFNGDPNVNDLPRVMRLPGFLHMKTTTPFQTRMIGGHDGEPYELAEIVGTLRLTFDEPARVNGHTKTDDIIVDGSRNNALTSHAGKLRRAGAAPAEIDAALQVLNKARCSPPLPAAEVAGIAQSVGKYEPARGCDTEDGVARAFVDRHGHDFRVCPGLGWMRWTADHWERDDKLAHISIMRKLASDLGAVAATATENKRLASSKFAMGSLAFARADQRIVHGAEEFDREPHELNTPAGIVDLRTGTLRDHKRDLVTKATAVAPDFTASRAVWHDFLRSIFADDVEIVDFVRRLLGYSITGETREQVLAFFFGTGANGKSTLLDVVMELLGSYAIKLPSDSLMAHHGDRHPTDIAQLKGVRLAASNEIDEGEYWAESKLKELTGDRMLTARFMRGDFFTFQATHKHIIAGNHRPQVRAMDEAMRRRILLIPFGVRFEGSRRDNDLPAKLRATGAAILADLCEGAAEWYRVGLAVPASIRHASAEYAEAMDSLGTWIAECCTTGEGYDCTAKLLYDSYRGWKEARGEKAVSLTRWGEQMGSRGYAKVRSNGVRYQHIDLTGEARHAVEMGKK